MSNLSLTIFQNDQLLTILLVSLLALIVINIIFHFVKEKEKSTDRLLPPVLSFLRPTKQVQPYEKKDWFALTTIVVLYSIVSFWQLGSSVFPTTTWQPTSDTGGQEVTFHLTKTTKFDAIYTIYGEGDNNSNPTTYQIGNDGMEFFGSLDGTSWQLLATIENSSIYEYTIHTGSWDYPYIKMVSHSPNDTVTEIGFRNQDKEEFLPIEITKDDYATSNYPATLLIDEQDKLVVHPTYYDQAYFDEIYHPRNAWEIANGQTMYASVHPLLGTNIIALSIRLFGMSPFAYRLPGAIFGSLILIVLYAIAKRMFSKSSLATIATVLCACDFMHLTTSRIATLEPFSIFFILMMFYYMIEYLQTSFYDTPLNKTLRLLLMSGIFMGIGIATKWTACYSAIGLAILLFTNLFERFQEYRKAKKLLQNMDEISPEQRHEAILIRDFFPRKFWITILCCFVFFIFIPIVIYWISYIPDMVWRGSSWSISNVWDQNLYMYNYHAGLTATHPYQSNWYQWIIDARPIWYYYGTDAQGLTHTIACFSNPLLTWFGLPAIGYSFYKFITSKEHSPWIILVGLFTALGPWMFLVNRCVFSYHFYPTSFFFILAITYACKELWNTKKGRIAVLIFLFVYVALFLAFLPATAGFGTSGSYIKSLEWFGSWYFG